MSGIHHLRSVSVPSADSSVTRLLCGCLGLTSPWLVVASYVPSVYLCPRTLLSPVPPEYFPPAFPGSSLPATTATANGVCKYPGPGTSRSAVERLWILNLRRQFRTSQLLPPLLPSVSFHHRRFPGVVVGSHCLSTIAYLHSIGYLWLIQLSPSCEINSLNGCPSLKAYTSHCFSSASLM